MIDRGHAQLDETGPQQDATRCGARVSVVCDGEGRSWSSPGADGVEDSAGDDGGNRVGLVRVSDAEADGHADGGHASV